MRDSFKTKNYSSFGINFYRNIKSIKKAINHKLNKEIFYNLEKNELVEKYFTTVKKYEAFIKNLKNE